MKSANNPTRSISRNRMQNPSTQYRKTRAAAGGLFSQNNDYIDVKKLISTNQLMQN